MKNFLFPSLLVIAALAATPVAAQERNSVPAASHAVNPSISHHVPHKPAGHHPRAIHTGGKSRGAR